ncbi:MAG TPA: anti-phage dCTP deaminase [Candidatus Nanopelagicales bacterium]|nr:anti-phage dCTP deaminase [Candidatus Nanopelagicales bacterium]
MTSAQPLVPLRIPSTETRDSKKVVRDSASNEFVIAVVGHVGSGTSTVCGKLAELLAKAEFDATILKASDVIAAWAQRSGKPTPARDRKVLGSAQRLQDLGDEMRRGGDHAAVARELIKKIIETRKQKLGQAQGAEDLVLPDGAPRAYILDSVRHPAEVDLLRSLYQTAFALVGVVCDEEKRKDRLTEKFSDAGRMGAEQFMERDRKAPELYGQRVEDAFHLSDYFLDNSEPRWLDEKKRRPNEAWRLPDQLSRFIKIVTHAEIVRPTTAEVAMYVASGAKLRSACLSRQVGAALVDRNGNIVASGTNEAPRAGGGVYGQGFEDKPDGDKSDGRCAYDPDLKFCSNTKEQNKILEEIIEVFGKFVHELQARENQPETSIEALKLMGGLLGKERDSLKELLRKSRISGLIEFSRAIHAEMDALLSAARQGLSPVGGKMFVTTFPCHACARHLVSAGLDEVQFIEPYPKSKALSLHEDAITMDRDGWMEPSKRDGEIDKKRKDERETGVLRGPRVLFRPFVGVAPRLYARAFLKERDLKDSTTGDLRIAKPDWGTPWDIRRLSYVQLEAELVRQGG